MSWSSRDNCCYKEETGTEKKTVSHKLKKKEKAILQTKLLGCNYIFGI